MNLLHLWYRTYQCVFGLGARLLPWRRPETVTGPGSLARIPALLTKCGTRRPLVAASRRQCADPAFQQMLSRLEGYALFSDIQPNPPVSAVEAAAALYRREGCDSLVAVGGGSPMDTAKAAAALLARPDRTLSQLAGLLKVRRPIPPFIAVPTTAGTGSEVTFDAVITDTEAHEKLNILDIKIAPKVALVDPTVLKGLPEKVMASTGVDALIHAVEAYTCKAASPVTDAFALYAIDLIGANIREAVYQRTPESCKAMMLGSTMAGVAFGYSDVAAVHCIAEALGGRYDTPHGVSNAMVLSTVTEFNIPANTEKYAEIARHLGVDTTGMTEEEAAYSCVDAMKSICTDVKIPKMRDFEVIDPADFQALAEASFRNMSTPNNPRELSVQDFFDLLTKAYNA